MRPGQNKRTRGRNPSRKGPNPLTRSYESNGPDVKIRGTAHHVAEKYLQLARDAQSSGDPVAAESYLQHAEHYFRLIATAQLAQAQSQNGYVQQAGDAEMDDDEDDDFSALPDRFASPVERVPVQPVPAPQPYNDRQGAERPPYNGGDRQPYNGGGDRPSYNGERQHNGERQERFAQDRDRQRNDRPDRAQFERPVHQGQQHGQPDRNDRRNDRDRNNRGPRPPRDQNRDFVPRDQQPWAEQPRESVQAEAPQPRDMAREPQPSVEPVRDVAREPVYEAARPPVAEPRQVPQPAPAVDAGVGLPSFITAPVRVVSPEPDRAGEAKAAPKAAAGPIAADGFPAEVPGEAGAFPVRTRRRRRTRAEMDADEAARIAGNKDKAPAAE